MQSIKQDHVKCKYCKERIYIPHMYAHNLECNQSNHPNYKSEINSVVKQNQSRLQQSIVPNQETNIQQNSSRQPVQFVESNIYPPQQESTFKQYQSMKNERSSNYPQQNNSQEIQQLNQQSSNLYSESLLKQAQKKCEYCDQEYPTQMLEQHYPLCETKILIETLSLADDQDENNHYQEQYQQNTHVNQDHHQQQQYDDIDIHPNSSQNQSNPYVTRIQEVLLPDGRIKKTTTTKNQITGQTTQRIEIIQRNQQQYQQQQQQQQIFSPLLFNRPIQDQNQNNNIGSYFDQIFNTNLFQIQSRGRRNIFLPMINSSIFHQVPQQLENLAVIKYAPYEGLSQEYKQCSICLTNYDDGEELILLPCIHRFHKNCISEWFKEQTTCPICKTDVTEQEMAFEEDDQL